MEKLPSSANRPEPPKPKKRAGILPMLGIAAAGHIGVIAGAVEAQDYIAGREHEATKNHQREAHEQMQQARQEAIQQARTEAARGDINIWNFLVKTNIIDAEESGRLASNPNEAERSLVKVLHRFQERWHSEPIIHSTEDIRQLVTALRYAFDGHPYYAGLASLNPLSFLRDRGGPCGALSFSTISLLNRVGFGDQIGVRIYLSGENGEPGHAAPTVIFQDANGNRHEADLTAGGTEAFPSGTRLSLTQIVEGYAAFHQLPVAREYQQSLVQSMQIQGGDRAWGFLMPTPTDRRPIPAGAVPFYASNAFLDYQTDQSARTLGADHRIPVGANEEAMETANEHVSSESFEEGSARRQAYNLLRYNFSRYATRSSEGLHADQQDFIPTDSFTIDQWDQLSHSIQWAEQHLYQEAATSLERLEGLGLVVGLYQQAYNRSALERRVDPAQFALEKIHRYQAEVEEWFLRNENNPTLSTHLEMAYRHDDVSIIMPIIMTGEHGLDLLFRQYDTVYSAPRSDRHAPDTQIRNEILAYLLLADSSRGRALERANIFPIYEQFALMEVLERIHFRNDEQDIGAVFSGADPFSKNFQAKESLFYNLNGRMYYDIATQREGLEAPTSPLRSLSQLVQEIHVYATAHRKDPQWENAIVEYGICRVRDQVLGALTALVGVDPTIVKERFRPFFEDSIRWLEAHPNERTESLKVGLRRDYGSNTSP